MDTCFGKSLGLLQDWDQILTKDRRIKRNERKDLELGDEADIFFAPLILAFIC